MRNEAVINLQMGLHRTASLCHDREAIKLEGEREAERSATAQQS